MLRRLGGDQRDALHLVGAAGIERAIGDEAVVVAAGLLDVEAGGLDRLGVAAARDRAGDARGPARRCAWCSPLGAAADDVGEREPPARSKHARGLGEDLALDDGRLITPLEMTASKSRRRTAARRYKPRRNGPARTRRGRAAAPLWRAAHP